MANVKVSALPVATTIAPADTLYLVQGGASKQGPSSLLWKPTAVGNANYTILATDVQVYTSVAFTGPHTWTLPTAAAYGAGRILRVVDSISTVGTTNSLTIAKAAGDGGGTLVVLSQAGQAMLLASDGVSNWTVVGAGIAAIGNSYQTATISTTSTTASTQGAVATHFMNLAFNAGSSPYIASITLPYTNISQGDVNNALLTVAASLNPTIKIFDNTTAGTLLFEWDPDGQATVINCVFVFTGSAWYLHDAHFWA